MKNIVKLAFFSFILFIFGLSCSLPEEGKDFEYSSIDSIGWSVQNIDEDFWTDNSVGYADLYYLFVIELNNLNVTLGDIDSVYIENRNGIYWDLSSESLSIENDYLYLVGLYYDNGSILPIGNSDFTVTYKDGKTAEYTLIITAPGSTSTDGYDYVYSPENIPNTPNNYAPVVSFAYGLSNGTITSTDMQMDFFVDDTLAYNGFLFFYDSDGNWIGVSDEFRDPVSNNITSLLSETTFTTDGSSANTVTLTSADIDFYGTYSMEDIYSACVAITDSSQYSTENVYYYDYQSLSAQYVF